MGRDVFLPPAKDIARICQVDLATARRWRRGASCPPKTALAVLAGDLGIFGKEWRGWRLRGGELISPDGWTIDRNTALSVPLMAAQIAQLRVDLRRAQEKLATREQLIDQPEPLSWVIMGNERSR